MKLISKGTIAFFRNNAQLLYGVALLVLIPAALVFNTWIYVSNSQKVMDKEFLRKGELATSLISIQVPGLLNNREKLQELVEEIVKSNDELYSLDILIPKGENFQIVASLDPKAIGAVSKYNYNVIAWHQGEAIGYETKSGALSTEDQGNIGSQRYWVIVHPVKDKSGNKVAIVSAKLSSAVIDNLMRDNFSRTLAILIVSLIVIILLLMNNMRLFQYSFLFRKLKEVDQMKDEFISMASHELRSPITGIRGYLGMLLDGSFGKIPPEPLEKIKIVLAESNRLSDLVEDLLEVSRITQGRIKIDIKPVDIKVVISEIIKTFEYQAKQKGLSLRIRIDDGLPAVLADQNRLKQVLVNLLSNAIKYTLEGSVEISASLQRGKKDMIKIKVSDTGIGMSAKDRERLFEKFYRIRNEKTDKIIGTGLGLWITKELIVMMDGEIYVDSIEGKGTEMTVLLPVTSGDQKKK